MEDFKHILVINEDGSHMSNQKLFRENIDVLKISISAVWGGPCHPSGGRCQVYYNIANLKPKFNFMHILVINEDILG